MQDLFSSLDAVNDMGELVTSHLPCEDCGSSDALAVYTNNTYCHSCKAWHPTDDREEHIETEFTVGKIGRIEDRKINKEIAKFYNVSCILDESNNIIKHIYPYYSNNKRVAQKIRTVADKSFFTEGKLTIKSELFGQHLFTSFNKKYLIITEGELDAMAAFQMADGIWPCVSIPLGAGSAYNSIKSNLDYVNLFDHIVLAFDNDEQGRIASLEVAKLFESGKCKLLKFPTGIKDACDMHLADRAKDFINLVYNAEQYKPEGIVDLYDQKARFLKAREERVNSKWMYPFPCMNKESYGFGSNELVILTAETGIGKTSLVREIQNHLLATSDVKIGVMYIEETIADTFGRTMGLVMKEPIHLPTIDLNQDKLDEAMETIGRGRLFAYEHFGSTGLDDILYRIRYMNKALGVQFIILDHISMLVDERYEDERRAMDNIVDKLRLITIELNITIIAISHLNRAGTLWGTSKIEKLANTIIKLERANMSEDETERCRSKVLFLKNRFGGRTGTVGYLDYNPITNKLEEDNDYKEIKGEETKSFGSASF